MWVICIPPSLPAYPLDPFTCRWTVWPWVLEVCSRQSTLIKRCIHILLITAIVILFNASPRPRKWNCSAVANNICPDLTIQPHPQSVVMEVERMGGNPERYVTQVTLLNSSMNWRMCLGVPSWNCLISNNEEWRTQWLALKGRVQASRGRYPSSHVYDIIVNI